MLKNSLLTFLKQINVKDNSNRINNNTKTQLDSCGKQKNNGK